MKVVIFLFMISVQIFAGSSKTVIGYFANWQWYDRDKTMNPITFPYEKYDILNYAFFKADTDGSITESDSWADENLLLGENDWNNGGYKEGTSVIENAHAAGVKVLLATGGWPGSTQQSSDNFPGIASDPTKRAKMISDLSALIDKYGFDGVDLDWEYPGYADHNGTEADYANFVILLQGIRDMLDTKNGDMILTACFSGDPAKIVGKFDMAKLNTILDHFNIMTYDYYGSFDAEAGDNSPLYPSKSFTTQPGFSASESAKMFANEGALKEKINIGAGFYGRSFAGAKDLGDTHSGNDTETWVDDEGMPMYYNILKKLESGEFTEKWDDDGKEPYAVRTDGTGDLVSYENPTSVALKAQYVVDNGYGGMIVWETSGDLIDRDTDKVIDETPLISAIDDVFDTPTSAVSNNQYTMDSDKILVYPNPISNKATIQINISSNALTVEVCDIVGNVIFTYNTISTNNGKVTLPLDAFNFSAGVYIVKVINKNGEKIIKHIVKTK